jgi:Sulfotransferase domain
MQQQQKKIFGIGLSRTGTTSLDLALRILGYRSIHYPPLNRLREVLNYYDAAVDTPVACSFRELDKLYPGSRFILTIRDFRSWLASTQQFFHGPPPIEPWRCEVRLKTYGVLNWNRSAFLSAYHRHVETVLDHFGDRPDQLLVIDITAGEGWETLCPFLGTAVPAEAFPHGAGGRPVPNSTPTAR